MSRLANVKASLLAFSTVVRAPALAGAKVDNGCPFSRA